MPNPVKNMIANGIPMTAGLVLWSIIAIGLSAPVIAYLFVQMMHL